MPPGVEVYEINGPFFFGVADRLKGMLDVFEKPPGVFILRMRHVPALDATGLYALDVFASRCRKKGTVVVLSGVQEQPLQVIEKMGFDKVAGRENICGHIDEALQRAEEILAARPSGRRVKR